MKKLILMVLLAAALGASAQESNVFAESFEGMFDVEAPAWIPEGVNNNPPPPVPLDGGLVALLAAGGAVGYRRLRRRRV